MSTNGMTRMTPEGSVAAIAKALQRINTMQDSLDEKDATIARLTAERDALRDALETIAESHDAGRHDGLPEECPAHDDVTMWLAARAALAQQKEGEGQ